MKFLTLAILAIASLGIASPITSTATSDTSTGAGLEKICNCNAELICKEGCRIFAGTPAGHVSETFCELGCAGASGCDVNQCSARSDI
ncbi:hypothetical protein PENSTE_c010G07279 [Penicillium steckii]|uniref:Uncharacterized protein n=1 Tax=Penicillium steckii TaxID=303698 RepID=A0A1V6T9D1_9EURO|nr:hypothetical protein PENSTE_c010G07279 [Penicillium steckii]